MAYNDISINLYVNNNSDATVPLNGEMALILNGTSYGSSYPYVRTADPHMTFSPSPVSLGPGESVTLTTSRWADSESGRGISGALPADASLTAASGNTSNILLYVTEPDGTSNSSWVTCSMLDSNTAFVEGGTYLINVLSYSPSGGGDSGDGDDPSGGGDDPSGGGDTPSGFGSKVIYNLSEFDPSKAASGALCVMVAKNYSAATIVSTNSSFGGAGICRSKRTDRYLLTVSSVGYEFNDKGNSVEDVSSSYKLLLGEVVLSLAEAGGAVDSSTKTVVTRSADGSYSSTTTDEDTTVLVDSLTARDNFAINALKTLMLRADKDPSTLSNNEMAFYCDVAYLWAANMMSAAAKVRATIEDESGPSVDEESLTTNTEKLLYDMSEAIIEAKETMEDLAQAVLNLDTHICDKLQALVEK